MQLTCWPWYSKDSNQTNSDVSLGLTLLRKLGTRNLNFWVRNGDIGMFAYLSGHVHYDYTKGNNYWAPLKIQNNS